MRKVIAVPALLVGALVVGAALTSHPSDTKDAAARSSAAAPKASVSHSPKVTAGLGARDASADVKVGKFAKPDAIGVVYGTVRVTNHSSKRSDYMVTVALESGSEQIDTGFAIVTGLEPGQSTTKKVAYLGVDGAPVSGAHQVVQEVERTASS